MFRVIEAVRLLPHVAFGGDLGVFGAANVPVVVEATVFGMLTDRVPPPRGGTSLDRRPHTFGVYARA